MATIKELKDFLENFDDNEQVYIGYDDNDELRCAVWTEQAIIESSNDYNKTDESEIVEIETALEVLANSDYHYHYMEIEVE